MNILDLTLLDEDDDAPTSQLRPPVSSLHRAPPNLPTVALPSTDSTTTPSANRAPLTAGTWAPSGPSSSRSCTSASGGVGAATTAPDLDGRARRAEVGARPAKMTDGAAKGKDEPRAGFSAEWRSNGGAGPDNGRPPSSEARPQLDPVAPTPPSARRLSSSTSKAHQNSPATANLSSDDELSMSRDLQGASAHRGQLRMSADGRSTGPSKQRRAPQPQPQPARSQALAIGSQKDTATAGISVEKGKGRPETDSSAASPPLSGAKGLASPRSRTSTNFQRSAPTTSDRHGLTSQPFDDVDAPSSQPPATIGDSDSDIEILTSARPASSQPSRLPLPRPSAGADPRPAPSSTSAKRAGADAARPSPRLPGLKSTDVQQSEDPSGSLDRGGASPAIAGESSIRSATSTAPSEDELEAASSKSAAVTSNGHASVPARADEVVETENRDHLTFRLQSAEGAQSTASETSTKEVDSIAGIAFQSFNDPGAQPTPSLAPALKHHVVGASTGFEGAGPPSAGRPPRPAGSKTARKSVRGLPTSRGRGGARKSTRGGAPSSMLGQHRSASVSLPRSRSPSASGSDSEALTDSHTVEPSKMVDAVKALPAEATTPQPPAKRPRGVTSHGERDASQPKDEATCAFSAATDLRTSNDDKDQAKVDDLQAKLEKFKNAQRRLPPWARQIAGPSFDWAAELRWEIPHDITSREERAREQGSEHTLTRYRYKDLFEEMIREATTEDYPANAQARRPKIRVIPADDLPPEAWSSPPFEFIYTNRVVYADGIVPEQAPGCDCEGDCNSPKNRATCRCLKRQIQATTTRSDVDHGLHRSEIKDFAWSAKGVLNERVFLFNDLIIECNSQCGCGPGCRNRVVGNRVGISVDIFWTGVKGWGVRLPESYEDEHGNVYKQREVKKGEPLAIYAGELLRTPDSAERDDLVYGHVQRSYIYDLDSYLIGEEVRADAPVDVVDKLDLKHHDGTAKSGGGHVKPNEDEEFESIYSVDAMNLGNWTRFANHTCQGFNTVARPVYVDDMAVTRPLWVYIAKCDIKPGEEITISYYGDRDAKDEHDEDATARKRWKKQAEQAPEHYRCYCGKKFCRGVMFRVNTDDDEDGEDDKDVLSILSAAHTI
ncbi:hypothetical protein JCM10207_003666 [Rhodosporidiobolus poonsookiae]